MYCILLYLMMVEQIQKHKIKHNIAIPKLLCSLSINGCGYGVFNFIGTIMHGFVNTYGDLYAWKYCLRVHHINTFFLFRIKH